MKKYIIIGADYDGENTAYIYGKYNTEAEAVKALKEAYEYDKEALFHIDFDKFRHNEYRISNSERDIKVKIEVIEF